MPSYRKNYSLYSRKNPSGTVVWYYRTYTPDGIRTVGKSTGCTSKTKADLFCQRLMKDGKLVQGSSMTFEAYATNWFVWGKCPYVKDRLANGTETKAGITEGYVKILSNALRLYIIPYFGKIKLEALTPAKIKAWRIWLQEEKGIANRTINNAVGALKIMTDWALNENLLMFDPFRSISALMTDDHIRDAFTIEECQAVLTYKWDMYLAWLYNLTAAVTGMRQAEIRAIRKETVFSKYIDVSDQYGPKGLAPLKTKEQRKVPIPPALYSLLQQELKDRTYVFLLKGEKVPMSRHVVVLRLDYAFTQDMKAVKKDRGLCFHSWRHFFNTYLLSENVTSDKVRAIMGHSEGKGTMTETYTSWKPEMFPEVYSAQEKLIHLFLDNNRNVSV